LGFGNQKKKKKKKKKKKVKEKGCVVIEIFLVSLSTSIKYYDPLSIIIIHYACL
jgi:hypothetical protein